MQDLEPELQEAWEHAGWEMQELAQEARKDLDISKFLDEDTEEADVLLMELAQEIEEVKAKLIDTPRLEKMPSDDTGDIWILAGWRLPGSCVGAPWEDYDDPESGKMLRQISPAHQFDPPEALREVAQCGSMLRQVTSEGDQYLKTRASSPMLRQVTSEMKRQLSLCSNHHDAVSSSPMPRQVTSDMKPQLSLCSSHHDAVSSPKKTSCNAIMKPQQTSCSKEGDDVSAAGGGTTPSFSEGYTEATVHISEMKRQSTDSTNSRTSPKAPTVPVPGSFALAISVYAISASAFCRGGETLTGPSLDLVVAQVLEEVASERAVQRQWTCFHPRRRPCIGLSAYIARMRQYLRCSDESLIMSCMYINRLTTLRPPMEVTHLTCHRLLLTSVLISMKFYDDVFPSNTYSACVFGVTLAEINMLEFEFLKLLDWRLHVGSSEYKWFLESLSQIGWDYLSQPATAQDV